MLNRLRLPEILRPDSISPVTTRRLAQPDHLRQSVSCVQADELTIEHVGWVELFAKPINTAGMAMGIAALHPSYKLRQLSPRHCERSEAIHSFFARHDGLLRRFATRNDGRGSVARMSSAKSGITSITVTVHLTHGELST